MVHSGADLQAAVALVLGYQQKSIKNKTISGIPIKEVVTERLTELLQAALASQRLEVRLHLGMHCILQDPFALAALVAASFEFAWGPTP